MVEAPESRRHILYLVKGWGFWYNGYRKVSPFWGFLALYKGGITMSGGKRFVSALLAMVMVGRLGIIVGMAAAASPAAQAQCGIADHGMAGRNAAAAEKCEYGMHWISSPDNLTSITSKGTGTNYIYPKKKDTAITCDAKKNIIIYESEESLPEELTIYNMSDGDMILLPAGTPITGKEISQDESTEFWVLKTANRSCNVTLASSSEEEMPNIPETIRIDVLPAGTPTVTLDNAGGNLTVDAKDNDTPIGDRTGYTYFWKVDQGNNTVTYYTADKASDIPPVTTGEFSCAVVEKATGRASAMSAPVSLPVSTACAAAPTGVTVTSGLPGTVYVRSGETKRYEPKASISGFNNADSCGETDHGYKIAWSVTGQTDGIGIDPDTGILTVTGKASGSQKVQITAKAVKDGQPFVAADPIDLTVNFWTLKIKHPTEGTDSDSLAVTVGANSIDQPFTFTTTVPSTETESYTFKWTLKQTGPAASDTHPGYIGINSETSAAPKVTLYKDSFLAAGVTDAQFALTAELTPKGGSPDKLVTPVFTITVSADGSPVPPVPDNPPDESACEKKPTAAQVLPQAPITMKITDTKPKTVQLSYKVTAWDEDSQCNTASHTSSHGGTAAEWSFAEAAPDWAALNKDTGILTLDMNNGTPLPKDYTLKVKAKVTGSGGASVETQPVDIAVTLSGCAATPNTVQIGGLPQDISISTSTTSYTIPLSVTWKTAGDCNIHSGDAHGETVKWSIADPAPAWAGIDGKTKKLTINGSKLGAGGSVTVKAEVTAPGGTSPAGTATVTVTPVAPDSDPITFEGANSAAPASEINISSSSAATVTSTYTATLPGDTPGNYEFSWTLTKKNSQETLPNYIELKDSDKQTVKVLVTTSKLPAAGVDQTFELTVTATPISGQSLFARVISAIMPLNGGSSAKVSSYSIRVRAAARSGGSGSSGSSGGADHSNWYQWQEVLEDIEDAKRGSTVKVSLGSNTNLPFYIYNALRGEDVNLQMKISGGYTWAVNGRTVQRLPANQIWVPLGIESYQSSKLTALCRDSRIKSFRLLNTDSFYGDMRLTMNLGSSYAKKTVYLYSYSESGNRLTYASSAKAADNGEVEFVFTDSLGVYAVTSMALYGESAVGTGGGAVGGNNPSVLYPPVVSLPAASQAPASAPSDEGSSENKPEESPMEPFPIPDTAPADTAFQPEPEPADSSIPIVVPLLILAIAGVITATVIMVNNSRNRDGFGID